MKKTTAILLTAAIISLTVLMTGFGGLNLFGLEADASDTSGSCGDSLTWSFDTASGALTLSGTGAMTDWSETTSEAPWSSLSESIKTVSLPSGLTSITDRAFDGCSGITAIEIPAGVTHIGDLAFHSCSGLTDISVNPENSAYSSEDGVLFNKDKSTLIQYPIGNTREKYTVPSSVNGIAHYAFAYCSGLKTVDFGESSKLTSIGDNAFYYGSSLTEITIPSGVTSIGSYSFMRCTALKSITVSSENGVYSSENGVLFNKGKTSLIRYPIGSGETSFIIPSGVKYIGVFALADCGSLKSVTIPSSVTSIDSWAFNNCSQLVNIFYFGSEADKSNISISGHNDPLVNAKWHFNFVFPSSLSINTSPAKTAYIAGDTLDTTGLTLTAAYESGSSETIQEGFECSPTALTTAGTQTITVSYGGQTCTFDVTVTPVSLIGCEIKTMPDKMEYYVGDTLKTKGLKLLASYNNGSTKTIKSGFECSPTALTTAGTQTITVSYGGQTCTFDVTVKDNPTLSIKNNPGEKSVNYGDGIKLTAVSAHLPEKSFITWFVNGSLAEIGEEFTLTDIRSDAIISVKIIDEQGNILTDAQGDEISAAETIKVKAGCWQRIVSFFKNLFKIDRVTAQ